MKKNKAKASRSTNAQIAALVEASARAHYTTVVLPMLRDGRKLRAQTLDNDTPARRSKAACRGRAPQSWRSEY